MCGIAGVFDTTGAPVDSATIERMIRVVRHRGPDGEGVFTSGHVGLGHRRLAVIDLTSAAAQPMANERGDVLLVYNGEIYNFQELRADLAAKGHRFVSRSDTEVIVHGYEAWGADVVSRLNGMFAFAIWDARKDTLFVARDRFGIKPLYYAFVDGRFIFGSEIKSLLQAFAWKREVDLEALAEYFTFQNVLSDRTLFAGIKMLPPGYRGFVGRGDASLRTERWWDMRFEPVSSLGFNEACEQTRYLVEAAVKRQLISDVPLGSYLSGGMDSGSIVAIASLAVPHLMTFTGGFDISLATGIEQNFDERAAAERVAGLFRTDHYETVLHPGSMERVLPELVWHLEDLRVGMSYQNYYIAHLASRFVRVCLSGGGGDELFGGYPWRYAALLQTQNRAAFDDASYALWQRLVPDSEKVAFFADSVLVQIAGFSPREVFDAVLADAPGSDDGWSSTMALNREMYFEAKTFLHGLLVVEDKVSSAHALEARLPFLDYNLVDFALSLPPTYKVALEGLLVAGTDHGTDAALVSSDGKHVLRAAMRGLLPEDVLGRKKQGFSTPDGSWYRGGAPDYIRQTLLSPRALERGYFQPSYIESVLDEHYQCRRNHRLLIWSLMSFEWWNRVFIDGERGFDV